MLKSKEILRKSNSIDEKAKSLSLEMSNFDYVITEDLLNPPLKDVWKLVKIMGFTKEQTDKIIDSIQKDLIGKEIHKGDNFHELIKDSFMKAITNSIKEMK